MNDDGIDGVEIAYFGEVKRGLLAPMEAQSSTQQNGERQPREGVARLEEPAQQGVDPALGRGHVPLPPESMQELGREPRRYFRRSFHRPYQGRQSGGLRRVQGAGQESRELHNVGYMEEEANGCNPFASVTPRHRLVASQGKLFAARGEM